MALNLTTKRFAILVATVAATGLAGGALSAHIFAPSEAHAQHPVLTVADRPLVVTVPHRGIEYRTPEGKLLATLKHAGNGAELDLVGGSGQPQLRLAVTDAGPSVAVLNRAGRKLGDLTGTEARAALSFYNARGEANATLENDDNGGRGAPSFTLDARSFISNHPIQGNLLPFDLWRLRYTSQGLTPPRL